MSGQIKVNITQALDDLGIQMYQESDTEKGTKLYYAAEGQTPAVGELPMPHVFFTI